MWSFLDWNLRQSNFKKCVTRLFEDFKILNVEVGDVLKCAISKKRVIFLCFANIKCDRLEYKLTMFNTVRYKASAI